MGISLGEMVRFRVTKIMPLWLLSIWYQLLRKHMPTRAILATIDQYAGRGH